MTTEHFRTITDGGEADEADHARRLDLDARYVRDGEQAVAYHDLVRERFSATPTAPSGERLRFVAGLNALGQWILDNPDWPLPWSVSLGARGPREVVEALSAEAGRAPFQGQDGTLQLSLTPTVPGIEYVAMYLTEVTR